MYELAKKSRENMKAKARQLASGDPHERVDGSSWREAEPELGDVQTGPRPISPRQFKRGGKITAMLGKDARHHAGRKPRASGGKAIIEDYMNRDMKEANEERSGSKHIGGMKRGGRSHKLLGGPNVGDLTVPQNRFGFQGAKSNLLKNGGKADEKQDKRLVKAVVKSDALKRKAGGRAKKGLGGLLPLLSPMAALLTSGDKDKDNTDTPVAQPKRHGGKAKCGGGGAYVNGGKIGDVDPIRGTYDKEGGRVARKAGGRAHKAAGGEDEGYFSGAGRTAPEHHIIGALKSHGMDYSHVNGVLHGHEIGYDRSGNRSMTKVPIGNNVNKLKRFLGYEKGGAAERKHGGRADAHWIQGAIKHPGSLHKELNVTDDKRIPEKKLEKAEHSKNKLVAKRAHLAETLRGMNREHHAHGGKAGKGKTTVNVIIGGGQPSAPPPMAPPMMPPRPPAQIAPPPPPMGGPGMPPGMPPGAPPMPPPGMPRKSGGRAMEAGAGSGEGRLEKTEMQKRVYP